MLSVFANLMKFNSQMQNVCNVQLLQLYIDNKLSKAWQSQVDAYQYFPFLTMC